MAKKRKKQKTNKTTKYGNPVGGNRPADYLEWETAKWLIQQLYKDGEFSMCIIITVGIYFGLRISDLRKIRWRELINLERITLREKKTGKAVSFPVNVHIRNLAMDVRSKIYNQSHYVIPPGYHTQNLNQRFKTIAKRYNIDIQNFSSHTLRKTFGRHYWEMKGHSAKALLYLNYKFNHRDIETTKRYLGIKKQEIDEVYNDVADDPVFV